MWVDTNSQPSNSCGQEMCFLLTGKEFFLACSNFAGWWNQISTMLGLLNHFRVYFVNIGYPLSFPTVMAKPWRVCEEDVQDYGDLVIGNQDIIIRYPHWNLLGLLYPHWTLAGVCFTRITRPEIFLGLTLSTPWQLSISYWVQRYCKAFSFLPSSGWVPGSS